MARHGAGTRHAVRETVRRLLDTCGTTYAEQAGITLADRPAPLYRLLVLTVLLSIRIRADIAVAAARELVKSGFGTPRRMLEASWPQRVEALGRAHYVRYDESMATALGDGARRLDLPTDPAELAGLVPARVTLDDEPARQLTG